MTFTALLTATLASAALGVGVWLSMIGAVTAATAGGAVCEADRRRYRWFGMAVAAIGVVVFVVGAIAGVACL